jgi:hypothetical protein
VTITKSLLAAACARSVQIAVQHQHVARAQRHLRTFSSMHLLSRLTASRLMPDCLRSRSSACGLADVARGRRHHGFGDAGAAGIEQVAEVRRRVLRRRKLFCAKSATCCFEPHRADHAADPDPRIRRWCQPRVVAGLQCEQQRRVMQRFGFAQRHAHQRDCPR